MRKLTVALMAAALLAACSKPEPAPEPVRSVRTMTVASGEAAAVHEYAAEVRARTESALGFRVGGKLIRREVELGQTVKAGQVLAQLDPRDLQLGQDAARAALTAAQASYVQAQADFKRFKDLRDQGFISAAEFDRHQTELAAARGQYDQARAQAGVQANQAGYATLVADAPGVITEVLADPGTVVGAGTPVVRLAHDGPKDVVFSVPEDQIAVVRAQAEVPGALKVRLWGSEQLLPANVREIAAAADPVTRTFLVKADIGQAAVPLGRTATALLRLPTTVGVTRLPLAAVTDLAGRPAVWVVNKSTMTVHPQPVQVAGADGNEVLVAAGLQPGQVVVTAGVHVLTPGQKVSFFVEPQASALAMSDNAH
jgi:RND family efflux transporter MFP subunit